MRFLLVGFFLHLVSLSTAFSQGRVGAQSGAARSVFVEVWETVRDHFFDSSYNGLDWDAVRGAYEARAEKAADVEELSIVINEMLSELGASHTRFYTGLEPEYYQLLDLFESGPLGEEVERLFPGGEVAYEGIGLFTQELEGKVFVSGVLELCPAERAGLQVGDQIVSADGEPFHRIRSFRGKAGKNVRLMVRSADRSERAEEITVVPENIRPNQAFVSAMKTSVRVIQEQGVRIGYIHIWSYAGEAYQELLVEEIASGRLRAVDALVVDLRDGWGGANPQYLNVFNKNVPVLTQIQRSGETVRWDPQWRKPVALLVNGGTRSGKEVFAYGFKKFGLGQLVGERTAGAVTAGRPFLMADGGLLLLAVADVLVDGERLEGKGVTPDVEVPFPIAYARGKDPQLQKAVEILVEELGSELGRPRTATETKDHSTH